MRILLRSLLAGLLGLALALPGVAEPLRARFVDVGQGDAILLRTPAGRGWLVDGGPRRSAVTVALREAMAGMGLEELDGVVISHPHLDHFGGLRRLVEQVPVGQVLYGIDIDATTYNRFKATLEARGVPYQHVPVGPLAWDPALEVEVLHTGAQHRLDQEVALVMGAFEVEAAQLGEVLIRGCSRATPFGIDLNDHSVVLRVSYGDFDLLLTGDATEEVEARILESGKTLEAEVLKVGHHGSRYSSTLEFLQGTELDAAVVQCAAGNSYGHPHREAVRRIQGQGAPLRRNDLEGALELTAWEDGRFEIEELD